MATHQPKVDYSLRPAKAIERRMIVEMLGHLGPLHRPEAYRYIGMGSIYFRDFMLVHRRLGINDMVTIEGDPAAAKRIEFNRPLSCIVVEMGQTGTVLPRLDLASRPAIIWLDYESHVHPGVLGDIDTLMLACPERTVVMVTVNASRIVDEAKAEEWRAALPNRPEPRQPVRQREWQILSYRVLAERFAQAIGSRSSGVGATAALRFQQMCHFVYADGSTMLTVGGVLLNDPITTAWDATGISSLPYFRDGEDPYRIELPRLTRKELQYLVGELPVGHGNVESAARAIGISVTDARNLAAHYRYASVFMEADET